MNLNLKHFILEKIQEALKANGALKNHQAQMALMNGSIKLTG